MLLVVIPFPNFTSSEKSDLIRNCKSILQIKRKWYSVDETTLEFNGPFPRSAITGSHESLGSMLASMVESYESDILDLRQRVDKNDIIAGRTAKISKRQSEKFKEYISRRPVETPWPDMETDRCDEQLPTFLVKELVSHSVGIAYGRWDVRISLDSTIMPKLPALFDPLPVCPPGMLVGPDGLPAESGRIVSEEWLRARPDANTLPPEGTVKCPTITNTGYPPLMISWDGVLVDDPGFNGSQVHREDIVRRVRQVLGLLWKDKAEDIEREACDILGVSELRTYFRKGFFPDHIKRYSKSRRKAPIYWQLSTPSASYSVWLYYHRFTKDTFYKVVNEFLAPKLQFEEQELLNARQRYGASPTASQRKEITAREIFVAELKTFKDELARIAPLWNPNLNDGVIINFAPLWRLVPQNRSWQKECIKVWDKLVRGDYDWAHLAMHLWPERVVPKCAKDRSLAIAHDLEETLWEEDEDGKWKRKKVSKETMEALIRERTSSTVKAALEDLLKAPVPAGATRKKRKKKA